MSREDLRLLATDLRRLLHAGRDALAGAEVLGKWVPKLRALQRKVPALAPVAAAVRRIAEADSTEAAPALLALLLLTRQADSALATAGVEGSLTPLADAGPWTTPAPADDLYPAVAALAGKGGKRSGRVDAITTLIAEQEAADLRLVAAWQRALGDSFDDLADLAAEQVLPAFGPAVAEDLLRDLDPRTGGRREGRRLLALCRIEPGVGANLCRIALREGVAVLRGYALRGLALAGGTDDVAQHARQLFEQATDNQARRAILQALVAVGPNAPGVLPVLLEASTAADYGTYDLALEGIRRIGRAAVPALAANLTASDRRVRIAATWALNRIGAHAAGAVPALTAALADADWEICRNAAAALGKIGPPALSALPALQALARDAVNEDTRRHAAQAVRLVQDPKLADPV